LHWSPFWVLRASSRDGRQRIVQLADERSLERDAEECQKARGQLTNTRTRLAAEMSWLPGVSPRKAEQLVARVAETPGTVEPGIAPLARVNLLVAGFEAQGGRGAQREVSSAILQIASELDELVPSSIRRDVNEDRVASGFPQIASDDAIEAELTVRRRQIRDVVKDTLNRIPTDRLVALLTELVEASTDNGEQHGAALVDELVDTYQVEAHEFLTKEARNVSRLVEATRHVAEVDRPSASELVACLDRVARNWDKVAQPIQVSAKARGLMHDESNAVAFEIRELAVDLFNRYDMVGESKRLTDMLREVFAEVPQVAEQAERDAGALADIVKNRTEWRREISYSAEVGIAFKGKLSISPDGVSWKDKIYPLEAVTRVRWGGVKHSVNGIPTGTTYTLAFGDERSESVVELRRKEVYSAFLERLWRAVCARLVVDLLRSLRAGDVLNFGGTAISDDHVVLTRHKWIGAGESVPCGWHHVKIWNQDGSFAIGSQNDTKVYAMLSYIKIPNVHVLEQAIRMAFKQGAARLSDVLEDE
jgi:hypothetical protein